MRALFVHQNFPGQFKHLAPHVSRQLGWETHVLCLRKDAPAGWGGLHIHPYKLGRGNGTNVHPWVVDLETKTIRGEAAFRAGMALRQEGFTPDVIVAHPGWGESLFLNEVWPKAKLGIYCEYFYPTQGGDVGFDPEFTQVDDTTPCRVRMKNVNNLMHFEIASRGISPMHWQASTFPEHFRSRISVIHDGIDTDAVKPFAGASVQLRGKLSLTRDDEVITFVNRNLEPYRGYHVFMRALPELLRRRPKARVIIVGGDDVSYGAAPPDGKTWRNIFLDEVRADLDMERVHFVGKIPYSVFLTLLQVSRVHVYLTYPFVLSWSFLEAMSTGCAVVASDTEPVREVVQHGETGRLINFFDRNALVEQVCELLDDPEERARLGANAREHARAQYDLRSVCLPNQVQWLHQLAA